MKFTYAAKDFKTGIIVTFYLFNFSGIMLGSLIGTEIGTTGVYYINITPAPGEYILGVVEVGIWKAYKHIKI